MSRKIRREKQRQQDKQRQREKPSGKDPFKPLYFIIIAFCLTGYYFRHNFKWFPLLVILVIPAVLMLMKRHKKHIDLDSYAWVCLLFPVGFLLLCIDITHRPDGLRAIWKPWLIVTAMLTGIMVWLAAGSQSGRWMKMFYVTLGTGFSAVMSIGVVYYFNYVLDFSTPEYQSYKITHKSFSKGKNRNNRVEFTPVGLENGVIIKAHVSRKYYESVELQDTEEILMRKGAFGIRWYHLEGEH